ncbi:MAG TPA: ester cyclase [Verrucomicrobiae bacterium]|jgi:predicted ester cyclase|nr:ester cyclase [Verrucomicrobiae bacterium]
MSAEQNKAMVRRFFEEVWNHGEDDVVDEIFAPTILFNGQSITREALKRGLAGRRAAFSDIHVTVEDQVAEGEKVSTRRTWRATHRGPYRGVAPTGKQITWTQISVVRFSHGRVVEDWAVADEVGILQQLGALSA